MLVELFVFTAVIEQGRHLTHNDQLSLVGKVMFSDFNVFEPFPSQQNIYINLVLVKTNISHICEIPLSAFPTGTTSKLVGSSFTFFLR